MSDKIGVDVPAVAARFRKRPVVISAVRHDGPEPLSIETLEGTMLAQPGDWIITGVKGERYPCKPDIFAATYEPVDDIAMAKVKAFVHFGTYISTTDCERQIADFPGLQVERSDWARVTCPECKAR